jgi:hypothetical protein
MHSRIFIESCFYKEFFLGKNGVPSVEFVAGKIRVTIVKFLRSQEVEFFSNLCWKPQRGVERPEGL